MPEILEHVPDFTGREDLFGRSARELAIAEAALRMGKVNDDRIRDIMQELSEDRLFAGHVQAIGTAEDGSHDVYVTGLILTTDGWSKNKTVLHVMFPPNNPIYLDELMRVQNKQFTEKLGVNFWFRFPKDPDPIHAHDVHIVERYPPSFSVASLGAPDLPLFA